MKRICKLIIFMFTFLFLALSAFAESPRDQLQMMVEQLQKAPDDSALRKQVIRLAQTLKPAPDLPEAAITYEGRARFAFGHAKSEDDYLAAAKEYEKAVAAAPWVPSLYSDLCMAYEMAGKFEEAKNNCGYYLIGLTDPAEITDVKGRIAGLEFGIEKANSPQTRTATLLEKVEGARFVCDHNFSQTFGTHYADIYEVRGGELSLSLQIYAMGQASEVCGHSQAGLYPIGRASYRDGAFTLTGCEGDTHVHRIRADGQVIISTNPGWPDTEALRQ